jgi:iron complex outermembrane recepter protein
MIRSVFFSGVAGLAVAAMPAAAQRTDDNAVKTAEDAFGTSVGDEQIGIYNPNLVRGFSPVAAGNVRLEGLYFDQQANPTQRLVGGTTVHVGISAQGYPFPAPTGIADYQVRRPGAKALASIDMSLGPWASKGLEADVQLPLDGERMGLALGIGRYTDSQPHHSTSDLTSLAAIGRFKPSDDMEILPFWSRVRARDEESATLIFTTGDFLPPRVPRDRFLGQKWSDFSGATSNYGLIAKADVAGFDLSLGVFRSILAVTEDHIDLLFGTDETGRVANRVVVADGNNRYASTSGEVRVARSFVDGARRHKLILSLRGRDQNRRFGGAGLAQLGESQIGIQDFRPEQRPDIGAKTQDEVRQTTLALGYEGRWSHVGELSLGLQKTDYTKAITDPDPTVVFPKSTAAPWLFSGTGAIYLSPKIAAYAGYTRGLEESPVAPVEAVNRNEAPPAIRTLQKEAGLRWKMSEGVSAVIGVFDIEKPYFNLDGAGRFRQLGQVRNRGVEFSVAGPVAKGLYLVAGNVWLDATVSGEEVASGAIGRRPIGTFRRHSIASLDYQIPGIAPLSINAGFEATSARTANAKDSLRIPARAVLHLGGRYRFKVAQKPVLLRANVQNVFNTFGWAVGGTGFFIPNGSRRYSLSLAADI